MSQRNGKHRTKWTDGKGMTIDRIHRYSYLLVGLTHPNKQGADRLALVQGLTPGAKFLLVPEPDNPVDRNAILIFTAGDHVNDLGYLHSAAAKKINRMMECDATFSAELAYLYYGGKRIPDVIVYIFQLTPMLLSHRPIRRGAPVYRPERRIADKKPKS